MNVPFHFIGFHWEYVYSLSVKALARLAPGVWE